VAVEPDLPLENLVRPLQEFIPGCTAGRDAAPTDPAWAPRLVGLFDLPAPRPDGTGIRIGHVDSGFTQHVELDVAAYNLALSTSVIDSGGGSDPMPGGTSHGTATASVITSRHGTQLVNDQGVLMEGVSGLAVGAEMVAARALDGVVIVEAPILFSSAIADGLWHCIHNDCHVISMSFGGIVSLAVKDAIREAHRRDVILAAAAGNCVGFVVEPAALPEVIGCGGVGIDPATGVIHPWPGTSQGPGVDISAPAENVWVADWIQGQMVVRPGEGTSFAAPHVAGAAALWLQTHGRANLIARYQGSGARLGDVFRAVVRSSARVPAGWNTANNGAGVLDLVALLQEPLPAAVAAPPPQEVLDLIPVLAEPVDVVVDINRLVVRDDGEFWGGAEPYLLLTFFQIDGDTSRLEATLDVSAVLSGSVSLHAEMRPAPGRDSFVSITRRGGHGNVSPVNIGPLELSADGPKTVSIAAGVGRFSPAITPIPVRLLLDTGDALVGLDLVGLPGFVGVYAILMEEDFTPSSAVVAARNVVADGIRGILEDVLGELELSDLSVDPDAFVERQAEIEDEAMAAAAAEMNAWELLWGGVVDPDDQLIQAFAVANVLELGSPKPIQERYQGEHGDWLLVGEIRAG
jgi:hypothetical protein